MRIRTAIFIATTLLALAVGRPAAASAPGEDLEAFRGQLAGFVSGLEGLPGFDAARIAADRQRVAELRTEQLEALRQQASGIPNWTALPQTLHRLESRRAERMQPALAKSTSGSGDGSGESGEPGGGAEGGGEGGGEEPPVDEEEEFRDEFLYVVSELQEFSPYMEQGFKDRLDGLEGKIKNLSKRELKELHGKYRGRARGRKNPKPEAGQKAQATAAGKAGDLRSASNKDIFSDLEDALDDLEDAYEEIEELVAKIKDFKDQFGSQISSVSSELAGLPGKIEGYFDDLFDDVKAFLNTTLVPLKAQVPTDPAGVLSKLDLEGEQWYSTVVAQIPEIDLPCPATGTTLPGLGEVGTTEADYVCKRGIDWIAGAVYDLAPGDVYSSLGKLAAAGFYYPINYLCLCLEAQAAITGWDEDAAHRAHLAERLDATLSTRATESSVTLLRGALTDLDADVAKVEAKLDVLEVKAGDAETAASDQQAFLAAFRDLVLRLEIEQNLIEHPNDVVASFQLPEALGGFLELTRAISADTIRMNQSAAQRTHNAAKELGQGDASFAVGDYPRAYQSYQRAYRESVKQ